ncbi:PREDICTED: interferon regulatory factor 3 [Condylura cristata]|uniref:interferon regulatory factor 3 n=1 Tax=Condylura cristata TaxID=143302 RepID=UPI0003343664|nr:PREDICTED: interferon regulatory factor 3 [Condylura cristata]XP_012589258.1 PREDICTED: interferon regulatory factor 3 [Condylura cristata]XP_012589259.1 PREDICTED: interferon regulatory factor 3 [Condylura cristata]XP_012589260.1 PREDICTED: interferon regulatory factor 3 [Condylura cristata]
MGTPKPRIVPWLVSKLDRGHFEGVAWLDGSRTRFRIPWKHGLRQDTQQEDFGIFRAWAETSGAYKPGKDKPDLPTWKRNFRAALNRKEVVRLAEDRSKDPQDPHKVFEFVTPGGGCLPERDISPHTSDIQDEILGEFLNNMYLAPSPHPAEAPEHLPLHVLSPGVDTAAPSPSLEPSVNPLRPLLGPEGEWEFEVSAFYRGRQVFQQTVLSQKGLRLVGAAAEDQLPGQLVVLPDPKAFLTDRGVISLVQRVLSYLGGGLALWRAGQQLCAQRLGHCRTYWAVGEELLPDGGHGHNGEVPKDKEGSVLDLRPFVADLIAFIEGSGHSPRYTLWFCVGESWPQDQPWTKRLVMVKVVPMCLKILLDMARSGGASSLENTVDLHISNGQPLSLSSDQYKACLQDLLEDMEF